MAVTNRNPESVATSPENDAKETKKFRRYKGVLLDASFFHVLLEPLLPCLQWLLSILYCIRWELSRPLQVRVLPGWIPLMSCYSSLKDLQYLTLGQVFLGLPLLIKIVAGYYFTFVSPSVDRSGNVTAYALFATFITANKSNSVIAFVLGIPFERLIPYHQASSLVAVLLSIAHGYVAFAYGDSDRRRLERELDSSEDGSSWDLDMGALGGASISEDGGSGDGNQYGMMGANPNLAKYLFADENNTSGTLLALSMFLLVILSIFPIIRRKFFDLWLWTHILLAISTIVFCVMHEVTSILFIAFWWALDLLMRYAVMAGCRYPQHAKLDLVTSDVVKISFPKPAGFDYNAGQFVKIALADINMFAFHPISISSAPHESMVTLHVRQLGDWSKRLVELAQRKQQEGDETTVRILLEGPYGSLSMDIDDDVRYQMALCVSGGIGVTHTQSVAKKLLHESTKGRRLKHVRFVWAVRNLEMLKVMDSPLEDPTQTTTTSSSSGAGDVEMAQIGRVDTSDFETEIMHVTDPCEDSMSTPSNENKLSSPRLLQQDIFVTKAQQQMDHPVNMSNGRTIYFGRPSVEAIIADVKDEAEARGVTHVAVFGCGPSPLIDKLKDVCRQQSQLMASVQFDVHEEIFDF